MELWIRSQDKSNLIKVSDIWIDDTDMMDRCCVSIMANSNFSFELGNYKTKERALEVLDEIQKLIKPIFKINYEYDDSQPIIDGEWLKSLKAESKIEELSCYIYEMPKE